MKKKNGFTLIELLAIIVILAIIAVITVPIILNIIENSKVGAATDSAYGYKDAISKWYVTKLSEDSSYNIPNNSYKPSDLKTLGVSANGKEPESNSWVTIEKNKVTNACLQFDEYKIEIKNGEVNSTTKGNCIELQIPSCPGCVFAYYTDYKWIKGSGYGENESSGNNKLTNPNEDYFEDYTELNKSYFLGHVLDDNGYIIENYACGIEDDKPFCLEGKHASKYSSNIEVLNSIFSSCSDGSCVGTDVIGTASPSGGANVNDASNSSLGCRADNMGYLHCY